MRKALTRFINLLKPYKVPPLFQRMKTDNASKKKQRKKKKQIFNWMWGCPCKTVDLYLGQNSALVCSEGRLSRLSTKNLTTASRLRGDPQSWLIFVILFCFLKTHSDVTAEDQLGLKVSWWGGSSSVWRSVFTGASRLPADLGNGHPEKVLQGLSHLLRTDVVNWMSWCLKSQKKKKK